MIADGIQYTHNRLFAGLPQRFACFSFSSDGKVVVTGGADGCVRLWNVETAQEIRKFQVGPSSGVISEVRFTPEGRHLVVRNYNETLYILRLAEPAK
jgi:WD40 repeat protein